MSLPHQSAQSSPQHHAVLSHCGSNTDADSLLDPIDHTSHPRGIPIRTTRPSMEPDVSEQTPLLPPIPRVCAASDDNGQLTGDDHIPSTTMFRQELLVLTRYSLPVFVTHLFEYSFILASVMSIGHLSTIALAAATLGSMTASVMGYSIIQGLASTLDTLLPPAWTSDKPQLVGLWTQRMVLMTTLFLIPIVVIWLNAEPILLLLNQEPEVARLAGVYLRCASLGLPAYAFNCISRRYFQSQDLFAVPTRIILVVAPINAFLNWLFVHPLGLSFPGAPLATALSFNLVSVASLAYAYFFVPRTAWHPIGPEAWTGWGVLWRLGLSGIGQTASEWWSWELVGLAASQLGPVTLATQSVLLLSASCTYQAPFALSIATSVRIGNLLGQGNARRAGLAANTALVMAIGIAAVWSTLFFAFRKSWAYMFNNDLEVVDLVASILPLVALFQVFDGTGAITGGIFRARGKQFTSALLNLSAYYTLGIPLGLYLAFSLHMALPGLWLGLTSGLVYASVVGLWIGVLRVDWAEEAIRARERVQGDKPKEDPHARRELVREY